MNIGEIIRDTGFRCNKALGQNFVTDINLLRGIVADSKVTADDIVVEIGTGAGTLTRELASVCKKVYSFEVDDRLQPVLALSLQGLENVEVIFRDVLKMRDSEIAEIVGAPFKVVANLPYYITTPLVMRFLESGLDVVGLTVMVQKEVADRFTAMPNTSEYSAITLAIETAGSATVTRDVSRKMFFPVPNVDSAVVRVDIDRHKLDGENGALIHKLIRMAFSMRRKTLVNNLSAGLVAPKADIQAKIVAAGFSPLIRGEVLSLQDYISLSHQFEKENAENTENAVNIENAENANIEDDK